MSNTISPHDKLFKETMTRPEAAKEFMQQYLPPHIKSIVNLDTLCLKTDSFIDERLKGHLVDVLYSVDFGGAPGYVYILFEHLSSSDELVAFRLIKYMINIMSDHLNKNKTKTLPVIFPIVLYSGHTKYTAAKSIFDLFEEKHRGLAEKTLFCPYHFMDIRDISD